MPTKRGSTYGVPLAGASTLQQKAALRAERLLATMGPDMQMEDMPRYRENMLGSPQRFPMTSVAEQPMRNLYNAAALASDVKSRNANRKSTKATTVKAVKGGF